MEYTALYRKYRPLTFDEIVGQDHITRTLKNQIISKRVGHAYLFNGVRGTGKTSAAKVFSRAINCLNTKNGEPCNECAICKSALDGSLTDIVEMDAASNNSVEDIRAMRDEVNFLPTIAKYRVYIIDEVHMLSTGAFNALLKTLEEPPAHVKFILATTEPQKLPATILSRCQRFDFKKISPEDMQKRLQYVCEESNITITPDALKTIAVLSEGAMRDALSILERCMQEGGQIDQDRVKDLVGIPKLTYVSQIVSNIISESVEECLKIMDQVIEEGKDLNHFLWEMIKYVKDILVCQTNGKLDLYNEAELLQIKQIAAIASKERILSMIYSLSELENNMKWSSQRTIMFQVGIIKLCHEGDRKESSVGSEEIINLNKKMQFLEQKIANIAQGKVIHSSVTSVDNKVQKTAKIENKEPIRREMIEGPINENGTKVECWSKVVQNMKQNGKIMLYTNLISSTAVELNDMTIGIQFPNGLTPFGKTVLEKTENINEIARQLSMEYGKEMRVKLISNTKSQEKLDPIEAISQDLDIPINIIDE